jgi:hypothetical protein
MELCVMVNAFRLNMRGVLVKTKIMQCMDSEYT